MRSPCDVRSGAAGANGLPGPVAAKRLQICASGNDRGDGGFALVAVLLFMMVVAAAITPFVLAARTDFAIASGQYRTDRMNLLAEGLFDVVANRLAVPIDEAGEIGLPVNSHPLNALCSGVAVSVTIQDQAGLVDLNAAGRELLEVGFSALAVQGSAPRRLAILAETFRSPDAAGGRNPKVAPDELTSGPKHGPFEAVAELYEFAALRGIPVDRLTRVFSVYGRNPTIKAVAMSEPLAKLLPARPSARYPYIDINDEPSPFARIEITVRSQQSGDSGFAGAIVELSRNESGYRTVESVANPAFLAGDQPDFSANARCEDVFGPGIAGWMGQM